MGFLLCPFDYPLLSFRALTRIQICMGARLTRLGEAKEKLFSSTCTFIDTNRTEMPLTEAVFSHESLNQDRGI